jgi:hypothetical protein
MDTEDATKETLDEYAKNLEAFCDKQLPLLRKQAELVELQFKVDSFILNRKMVKSKLAEFEMAEKDAKAAADAELEKSKKQA